MSCVDKKDRRHSVALLYRQDATDEQKLERRSPSRRRPRRTWRASQSTWTFTKHSLGRSQSEPQGIGPCRRDNQSNAVFAGVAPARACDDFDVCRGEACRPLWSQQRATEPICSGGSIRAIDPDGPDSLSKGKKVRAASESS